MRTLLIAVLAMVSLSGLAHAEPKRVALIIGAQAYTGPAALSHPAEDASRIFTALTQAHFDAGDAPLINPSLDQLSTALRQFARKTRDADVAVLYFAGHGVAVDGQIFLTPVSAALQLEQDVYTEAFRLDDAVRMMQGARLRIVIMDACTDNPWQVHWGPTRAAANGLPVPETPDGVVLAFSAAAGHTTPDDGVYARVLAAHINQPGLNLDQTLSRVSTEVAGERHVGSELAPVYRAQGSAGQFFFVPPALPDPNAPLIDFVAAARQGSRQAYQHYADTHETGLFPYFAHDAAGLLGDADALRRDERGHGLQPVPPPAPRPDGSYAAEPCQQQLFLVFFEFNAYTMTKEANDILDNALTHMTRPGCTLSNVDIVGTADEAGETGVVVGFQRARIVADYLVGHGLARSNLTRLLVRGRDEAVLTDDDVRDVQNRRAEVIINYAR